MSSLITTNSYAPVDIHAVIVSHSMYEDAVVSAELLFQSGMRVSLVRTGDARPIREQPWTQIQLPNVGYGSAVNAAVRQARETSHNPPGWLLVLNDDFRVDDDWTSTAWDVMAGMPQSISVIGFDASPTWAFGSRRLSPKGSCFAVRWHSFIACGGFAPIFFLYFEETDLFERLQQDTDIALVPLTGSSHVGAASTGRSLRSGFQLVSSAREFRNRNQIPTRHIVRWFSLTCLSSLFAHQIGHVAGLFLGLLTWPSFRVRERLTQRWFGAAPYAARCQYLIQDDYD